MKGKSVMKAGKLLRISLDYSEGRAKKINEVKIEGDFFMHPEEGREKLESALKGAKLEKETLAKAIGEALEKEKLEVHGFDASQLADAIMLACAGRPKALTKKAIMDGLKLVEDPELMMNIVDLGLVYGVDTDGKNVHVKMTFTTPACPLAGYLTGEVEEKLRAIGARRVEVEIVWEPQWTPERMTKRAKAAMGIV